MQRLGLTESGVSVLLEELEELRKVETENQRAMIALGEESKEEHRSNGQLLYIAIWYAVENLKEENKKLLKRLETKDVGSKHIHTDGQHKPQDP